MKKSVLWVVLYSIFLGLFNLVFFTFGGTDHCATVWLSYGFIHAAYLTVAITSLTAFNKSSVPTLGFALSTIALAYFLAELAVGLIFILIGADILKFALVVQVILLGIFLAMFVANLIANIQTNENLAQSKAGAAFAKGCASKIRALSGKLSDNSAEKELERLGDTFYSSPVKSINATREIESTILREISNLEYAVMADDAKNAKLLIKKISSLIDERNRRIKAVN